MGINKITSLFSANADALQGSNQQQKGTTTTTATPSQDDEAVTVSSTLSSTSNASEDSARASKLDSITSLVRKGEYRADSTDVASALARDLF